MPHLLLGPIKPLADRLRGCFGDGGSILPALGGCTANVTQRPSSTPFLLAEVQHGLTNRSAGCPAPGSGTTAARLGLLCWDESASCRTGAPCSSALSSSSWAATAGPRTAPLPHPSRKGAAPSPDLPLIPRGGTARNGPVQCGFGPHQKPPQNFHGAALPRETALRNPFYLVKDESVVEDTEAWQLCHQPSLHVEGQQLLMAPV